MLFNKNLSTEQKKIIALSSVGGMLEFYDFTIYGLFSVYFSAQFFPSHDHFISIIASYSVFLVGYIVRPLGGIIFSHIGDEIGRKTVLIFTMILMGLASFGLGFLPNYASIGVWAPILMILLRLLQGLAIGGELPSMIVYVTESIPKQRGLAIGGVYAATLGGLLPSMLINIVITHYLTSEQINQFGWRIPFILGGLLCIVAYQVRRKLHETTAFSHLKEHVKFPLGELLKNHFGRFIIGIGLVAIMATPIFLTILFMPTYLTQILHFDAVKVSNAILLCTCVSIISVYLSGLLTTRFSLYALMKNLILLIIIASAICYFMLSRQTNLIIPLALFSLFQGALVLFPPVLLSYLFPIQIRLTGVALCYNVGFVLFGGLTPIIVTTIIEHTQMPYTSPFIWLLFTGFVAMFALIKVRKYLSDASL